MIEAQRIVSHAQHLPAAEREKFVERECAGRPQLRTQVLQLLSSSENEITWEAVEPLSAAQTLPRKNEEAPFLGTTRFEMQQRLGSGAFGTVYQVWDREEKVTLAAKVLHSREANILLRFKREFREIVGFHHENLVLLHELFSESEQWFFTMELVEGPNFLDYLRPEPGSCRSDCLRPALAQLVRGVRALHAAKRLHCDLKPGNVLVADEKRVVLLDFGLLVNLEPSGFQSTELAGTPAYMSPEQAKSLPLTEASDWYAVGVILHQALTGRFPAFARRSDGSGHSSRILQKIENVDGLPIDLIDLCERMLARDPALRPPGEEIETILNRQGAPARRPAPESSKAAILSPVDFFVGREKQIGTLSSAFDEARKGNLRVVLVEGPSGIGKSATVQEFIRRQKLNVRDLVALTGRCREFESVPYKGVDDLLDGLSQHLRQLPESEVNALLPREAFLLPRLFPVLGLVNGIAKAPVRSLPIPDQQERRQRTFAALRELLGRLSDRYPVIIWVDDLQWSDRDSSTFLADLSTSHERPALLLILTYRSEDAGVNPTLSYFDQTLSKQQASGEWRKILLTDLSLEESQAFFDEALKGLAGRSYRLRDRIRREAGGHPLFLQQLTHTALTRMDFRFPGGFPDLELETLLQQRIADLPPFAREALEYICLAAQPLSAPILFEAATENLGPDKRAVINLLSHERLLRVSGVDDLRLEPYHDQIRSAVTSVLGADKRRARHARLASVFLTQSKVEPQVLVTHYLQAGDVAAAYHWSIKAAALAEQQLAFDRASLSYQIALESGPALEDQADLYLKLADALGKAGRGYDAAHAYLESARRDWPRSFELRVSAAHEFMRSGHIDEALSLIGELASKCHIKPVKSPMGAMIKMAAGRIRTRVLLARGIRNLVSKTPSREKLRRLDLLRMGAVELTLANPLQAGCFQVEYVEEALRSGDDVHLAAALTIEAAIRASQGHSAEAFTFLKAGEKRAAKSGSMNSIGFTYLGRVYVDYQLGRLADGIAHAEQAVAFLRAKCTGVTWELTTVYLLLFAFKGWSGSLKGMRDSLRQLFKEGEARGDVNVEVSLRLLSCNHYAYLSAGEADECLRDTRGSLDKWSKKAFHLQHMGALYTTVETYLYMGKYDLAQKELAAKWGALSGSLILRWQILMTMSWFLRGRVMLAVWFQNPSDIDSYRETKRSVKRLERTRFSWAPPMRSVLLAGLAAGLGHCDEALRHLEDAHSGFSALGIHGFAAASRYTAGMLLTDERGRLLMQESTGFLRSQEVTNPEAFFRMLMPGWEKLPIAMTRSG